MTDLEINIALAELCGWTNIEKDLKYYEYVGTNPEGRHRRLIPDYWDDAYTFEALWPKLTEEKRLIFTNELCAIVDRDNPDAEEFASAFFATARQRVEAMLRAFDKWKE
jgi:predicted dehydrogenase